MKQLPMNIAVIGPQGSGKTTHSKALAVHFGLKHVDIGELIRQESRATGNKSKLINHLANKKGKLLPDGVVIEILVNHLYQVGFEDLVLDGLPRTVNQYHALVDLLCSHGSQLDKCIFLEIGDHEAVARVRERSRGDDRPQAIAARIEEFHPATQPLLEQLIKDDMVVTVPTNSSPVRVNHQLIKVVDKINSSLDESRKSLVSADTTKISINNKPEPYKVNPDKNLLYVLTHSESDYNKKNIFTGWLDSHLSPEGLEKAKIAAEILKNEKIDVAIHTRLVRTKQTLDEILTYHPDTKVMVDDRLIERDYGDLSGQSKVEYAQAHPDLYEIYHRSYDVAPPGGESMVVVEQRVLKALHEIIGLMKRDRVNVLIVSHGNAIRPIRRYFEKLTAEEMMRLEHQRHRIFAYEV